MRRQTEEEAILELVRKNGAIRPRDLCEHGLSRQALRRLYERNVLDRPSRGLYVLREGNFTEHHSLAEVAKLVPRGVICLLSALRFHDLTTQQPFEVWIAIGIKAWKPDVTSPPLRIVRFSGQSLSFGIEEHEVEGIKVCVYTPAKTIADCFKYRNKIGLDVAIEALRDCIQQKKATLDELWTAAKVCRMSNVMRPYLEAVT
ncbi:MAG TPA: transcriptional regulator [Gimesia maris]|uniref:Transcriptional regulator n=1 Tax=Gimesia maris TaxID=122 RepID=A0A3D3R5F5_9PLAN|nr:transcriptional regulator [Gimesia maris]|tara:strand:+ start:189 stop:794 length:606 start_codon:yes stop_codon:yes gene_type:complete